jgi:hypothetical protein
VEIVSIKRTVVCVRPHQYPGCGHKAVERGAADHDAPDLRLKVLTAPRDVLVDPYLITAHSFSHKNRQLSST